MDSVNTFVGGLVGLIVATGIGSGCCRFLGSVPRRWWLVVSLVSGVAIIDLTIMLVLFFGGGVLALKLTAACLTVIACYQMYRLRNHVWLVPRLKITLAYDRWFAAVVGAVVVLNLIIAVAPSTKIDELHYHMLLPKRVLEDGGLYLYRQPYELAIFPQMAFQLGLSAVHAAGSPEAGNVISWGLGAVLILLVAGVTTDLTQSTTAGWMTGAVAAVGLYSSVWHVTSGPHALGDLAIVSACLLALLPDEHIGGLRGKTRLAIVCLTSCTAASTKISILPLALALTVLVTYRAASQIGWKTSATTALGVWGMFYGPILVWTAVQCGSPFGLATAGVFRSDYFSPETIAQMATARAANQTGWINLLTALAPSVSVGFTATFCFLVYAAIVRRGPFRVLLGLVVGQALLISWLLPHDFRFLGGLQYVVLVLGTWAFWLSGRGSRLVAHWRMALFGLCLPWLAAQTYYAIPFVKVAAGLISRDSFRREYVAFTDDFRALDRILPERAVIYVVNSRLPSYYAPRPVVFTLQDLRGRSPVYRFTVGRDADSERGSLVCTKIVYENSQAVALAFRGPGRLPVRDRLRVENCSVNGAK